MSDYLFGDDFDFSLGEGDSGFWDHDFSDYDPDFYANAPLDPGASFGDVWDSVGTDLGDDTWTNFDLFGDTIVGDESGESGGVGGALNWLGKMLTGEGSGILADLLYGGASAYLMGNQVAQQNQNTDLLQKALSLQNASTQNSIKHSDINQFSALTNNAGNMTNNAYDVGRNGTRDALIAAVLGADKNLQGIDTSNFLNMSAQLRGAYEPVYQGYANDFVNHRNTIYPTEYASTAPFTSAAGGGGLNQVASAPNSFADLYGG